MNQNSTTSLKNSTELKSPSSITLEGEQLEAVDRITQWFRSSWFNKLSNNPSIFVLSGAAGTGKSTLIKFLDRTLASNRGIGAFTGKAVNTLREKGVADAKTIHCLCYISSCDIVTRKLIFNRREGTPYGLFIIDEASMISRNMYNDLLSFNIPILFVGDRHQLPPVDDDGLFNVMNKITFELTKIHRQAEGSPIIKAATDIRNNVFTGFQNYGDAVSNIDQTHFLSNALTYDQVICATNMTRVVINKLYRSLLGYDDDRPCVGDRIIILKNRNDLGVFNGQQLSIKSIKNVEEHAKHLILRVYDPSDNVFEERDIIVDIDSFNKTSGHRDMVCGPGDASIVPVDYGYAITCHKAQGSEYQRVLIIDDTERCPWSQEQKRKWLYTATTRAKENLNIINSKILY